MITSGISEPIKEVLDWTSFGSIVAAFFAWIPHISALLGMIWLGLRIWETDTVQKLFGRK